MLAVTRDDGERRTLPALALPPDVAEEIFQRSGRIRKIELELTSRELLSQ